MKLGFVILLLWVIVSSIGIWFVADGINYHIIDTKCNICRYKGAEIAIKCFEQGKETYSDDVGGYMIDCISAELKETK